VSLRGDVIFRDGGTNIGGTNVDVDGVGVKAGLVFSF
jgi:hypothetical protein